MHIYMDSCCVNRLRDDQSQSRVQAEAQALGEIISAVLRGKLTWSSSSFVEFELSRNPDSAKRMDALELLEMATQTITPDRSMIERGAELQAAGYTALDALHLACAEHAGADVLLTTDDRFLRRAERGNGNPRVRVANPIDWFGEVRTWLLKRQSTK